jgi:hypothetical protein
MIVSTLLEPILENYKHSALCTHYHTYYSPSHTLYSPCHICSSHQVKGRHHSTACPYIQEVVLKVADLETLYAGSMSGMEADAVVKEVVRKAAELETLYAG